jgi:hypothetical protein
MVCFASGVLDPPILDRYTDLARARYAAGATHDDVLRELRRNGLEKIDCTRVVHAATGTSVYDAKLLVHHSPVWADRREGDEHLEDLFWRVAFIMCSVEGGSVNEPDDWAAESRERRQRATAQLQEIVGTLPEAPAAYHHYIANSKLGAAFAALVAAGRRHRVPGGFWPAMATVADTLCLTKLLDDAEPTADDTDYVYAAHVVRQLTNTPH